CWTTAFSTSAWERAVNLVLLDATMELRGARVFPAGRLREPISHLRRATHIMITHADLAPVSAVNELVETAHHVAPHAPVMQSRHRPTGLYPLGDPTARRAAGELEGKRVAAVSALGNPAAFEGTLLSLGAEVAVSLAYDDHHHYSGEDCRRIHQAAVAHEAECIVVTEKDAVKLPPLSRDAPPVWALQVDLEVTAGSEQWEALLDLICHAT
ncbi:MAG: tetraacyldisaccharide 4'-kinase, partial [Armatimonadetes bacterium]|nr:tetraacyldisaccharide 4'-kinase [Armatimonadota bacterium]